jgi:hypothetical protein
MNDGPTATITVAFRTPGHLRESQTTLAGRIPRVARHLALAHEIEHRIRAGDLDDLAHAARAFGLTRARITQIVNLTLLAPSIQQAILALPAVERGRDAITERALRPIVAEPSWIRQLELWNNARRSAS